MEQVGGDKVEDKDDGVTRLKDFSLALGLSLWKA